MEEIQIVKTDQGAVNARILAREAKADFRRVEAASLKVRTHFTSAEAKRLFVRMFNTLQLNAHFISVIARTRIEHQDIEKEEASLRADIDAAKNLLNQALDGAEALFKANGISSFATYDTQPLVIEVGILSSSGRRYLEVLNQFDQLMPLLQTLEIHEVITTQELDIQRAALKRRIKDIANSARRLATGLRRRMNAMAARDGERGPVRGELPGASSTAHGVPPADDAAEDGSAAVTATLEPSMAPGGEVDGPGASSASAAMPGEAGMPQGDPDGPAEAVEATGAVVVRRMRRKVVDQGPAQVPAMASDAQAPIAAVGASGPQPADSIDAAMHPVD